ncbi:MAG TPA: HAD family phosphatase [Candidatus Binataceae bacterium]|nr:HAD family phosphatase [Candidatus Binataceae bacterium]
MIEAVLWDNDGVLVDTERLYFRATRETLALAGAELTREHFIEYIMRRGQSVWEGLLPHLDAAEIVRWRRIRDDAYSELLRAEACVIPGALETVRAMHGKHRMAIVTSSHREHFELAHRTSGLPALFEAILTREDYKESKPHPEPYLTALARLGVRADRSIAIEDSERGLIAARAAGLRCIVIPHELTEGGNFIEAAAKLASIAEVPATLAHLETLAHQLLEGHATIKGQSSGAPKK